jgi:hypothetical protein
MSVELDDIVTVARRGDERAAAEMIESAGAPTSVAKAYHDTGKRLYWKDKNLSAARSLFESGIAYALARADRADDKSERLALLSHAKAMAYDTASFCWPGWDEPGILIGEEEIDAGEQAANLNMQLAQELGRTGDPMANALFMIGAYHLVRQRYAEAAEVFARSRQIAIDAGDVDRTVLGEGYIAIAKVLDRQPGARQELIAILATLDPLDIQGDKFVYDQITTAARVFGI